MTRPLPSLALEMSHEGISLHQLAFDGHWHELARVALEDPALGARLANMRSIAVKLDGRRFKARIWLPEEQILRANISLMESDEKARIAKARDEIAAKFGGNPADYLVHLGKRVEGGAYAVAAVRLRTLQEARAFARSHGFRARGYSTRAPVEGFAEPPVFHLPADKLRLVGLALVAASAAALVLGGGYAFVRLDPFNLWEAPPKVADFAPFQRPDPGIDRSTAPPVTMASPGPAPRPQFAVLRVEPLTVVPPRRAHRPMIAPVQVALAAFAPPGAETLPELVRSTPQGAVNWPAPPAPLGSANLPDRLPDTGLFSIQERVAPLPRPEAEASPPPRPSGPMASYQGQPRPRSVANIRFVLEPLPPKAATLSPAGLEALLARSGLPVEELSRPAPPLVLANAIIIEPIPGLPPILPRLRSGRPVPEQLPPPPPPFVVVEGRPGVLPPRRPPPPAPAPAPETPPEQAEGQPFVLVSGQPGIVPPTRRPAPDAQTTPQEPQAAALFAVVSGAPDIRPAFRPRPEPPTTDEAEETPATTPRPNLPEDPPLPQQGTVTEEAAPPGDGAETGLAQAVDAAINTASNETEAATQTTPPPGASAFALLEGLPPLLPRLRSGGEIPIPASASASDPATAEANALRAPRRPQAIIDMPAPLDLTVSSAAPITATRAPHRNAAFATNAARIVEAASRQPRTSAPPVPADPRSVNLPTSASVARAATIEGAINLRRTNLLGVFGPTDNRTALILLSNGRRVRVQQGDTFAGWTVVAITAHSVRVRKRNREEILQMPPE